MIVTAIWIFRFRISCVIRTTSVLRRSSLDFNAFNLSHLPSVWLGIVALLRGAGCDCELGSFFCIATKFFGGEADTVHKAIGVGGVSDAAHGHERSAFNSLASAASTSAARQQTSEPVHPRNRTERSENGRGGRCPHRGSSLPIRVTSSLPFT